MIESVLSNNTFYISILVGCLFIVIILSVSSRKYLKCHLKRFLRIQIRKRIFERNIRVSDKDAFTSYYREVLCHFQEKNNELLGKILQKNHKCAFYVNRSISFLSSHRPSTVSSDQISYASIDDFREKIPLTTFDDYRPYIDRIIENGEKNMLTCSKIIFFSTSSGTTGKIKLMPVAENTLKLYFTIPVVAYSTIWRSLPSASFPSPEQRSFNLQGGKRTDLFPKSKDGIPIGPLTQIFSAVSSLRKYRFLLGSAYILPLDFIEQIPDFDTSTFIQLVFALSISNISYYSVIFAPGFLHSVKLIEKYYEEMCLCISSGDFNHSTLVRNIITDSKLIIGLSEELKQMTIEYGGESYRLKRAKYIRQQCQQPDHSALLHRLWPSLVFATTTTGGSFSVYKQELQFYCGDNVPLINHPIYAASEGFLGASASIHTDEYFLTPTSVFFEFIKEEDAHQVQPKTLLLSEIEPGKRYELVCTTEAGFVRYRMGDVVTCTRFLSRANDIVPLPSKPVEVPRVPLVSIAYRLGSLLDVFGEKTSEQHVMKALQQTIQQWKTRGISVNMCDFTSYPKLDVFPSSYIIFLELIDEENKIDYEQLQRIVDDDLERELCDVNHKYKEFRSGNRVGPLRCILVQPGTFSIFLTKELVTEQVSAVQIKPHRLLKIERHIQFFYDHRI